MKKVCLVLLLCGVAVPAMAQDFRAHIRRAPQPRPAYVAPRPGPGGAIVNGVRQGNPLQLINPLAPAGYGSGQEYVYHGEEHGADDPALHPREHRARPLGIKLFAFEW